MLSITNKPWFLKLVSTTGFLVVSQSRNDMSVEQPSRYTNIRDPKNAITTCGHMEKFIHIIIYSFNNDGFVNPPCSLFTQPLGYKHPQLYTFLLHTLLVIYLYSIIYLIFYVFKMCLPFQRSCVAWIFHKKHVRMIISQNQFINSHNHTSY